MRLREITSRLNEAAGTYGFYRPADKQEFVAHGGANVEHADYVMNNPAKFGLSQAEVDAVAAEAPREDPTGATPRQQQMARVLALMMAHGWVRINYFRGAWSFHALDEKTARRALIDYAKRHEVREANIEWGPNPADPDMCHTLWPESHVQKYIKFGKA